MLRQHASIRNTLLSIITLVILGICGLSWSSMQTSLASATGIKRYTAESTPLSCPDAKPVVSGVSASLDFCSPKYGGNVAGPVGSHVILLGENFSQDPTYWVLTPNNSLTTKTVSSCLASQAQPVQNCRRLQPPRTTRPAAGESLFAWTWDAADFPTTPDNYYFVAVIGQPPSQVITSSISFTLLDSQPPCIMVKTANQQSDCTGAQPFTLSAGTTITLLGTHWILGWRPGVQSTLEQVQVMASCAKPGQCSPDPLFSLVVTSITVQGTFTQQVTLPQDAIGTYLLTAFSTTDQQIATPDVNPNQSINIIIANSLTFGMSDDSTKLSMQVVKQQIVLTPTPTPSVNSHSGSNFSWKQALKVLLSVILWLACILAFAALVIALFSLIHYVWKNRKARKTSPAEQNQHNSSGQAPFYQEAQDLLLRDKARRK